MFLNIPSEFTKILRLRDSKNQIDANSRQTAFPTKRFPMFELSDMKHMISFRLGVRTCFARIIQSLLCPRQTVFIELWASRHKRIASTHAWAADALKLHVQLRKLPSGAFNMGKRANEQENRLTLAIKLERTIITREEVLLSLCSIDVE